MKSNRFLLGTVCVVGLAVEAVLMASCGGSGNNSTGSGGSNAGGSAATHSTGSQAGGGGSTFATGAGGAGCSKDKDCNGGVCNMGQCCDKAADVCGSSCCKGATVCLNEECVTPGKDCFNSADCGPGKYCETGLGMPQGDGGVPDAGPDGAAGCTQPLPIGGKCLPLPPVCAGDAGAPGPDAGCFADCEYHPPAGGPLNAVPKWTWGPTATQFPNFTDVWSTPVVGRVHDSNCDGKIDQLDSPVIVFVSGNDLQGNANGTNCQSVSQSGTTMCHTGVLRMLDGRTGEEIWSLDKASPTSVGFAGMSVALGDIDGDGRVDIVAVTGEGYVVLIDGDGNVLRTSDKPIPGNAESTFGWGGGVAIADMDGDGFPEIAFGSTVFSTTNNAITLKWTGAFGIGGGDVEEALSTFVDLDGAPDNHLELLAGNTAYNVDGTVLWHQAALPDGFPAVGDFNGDGKPDVALVGNGQLWILDGATGTIELGPVALPGTGSGGAPTIADFDGDGKPEIGVAMATFYSVMKPNFTTKTLDVLWSTPNHDLSSSVTGSTVFDFEGDGKPEVIYADECFLWVFDGQTGAVRFATPHTSFTGTEASLVADVDGDGHAEIVMVTNGAYPASGPGGWGCLDTSGNPETINGVTWTPSALPNKSYRGIVSFGDSSNSWVGTRTLWSEHTYHVSNICDDRDGACPAPNVYGSIPKVETKNWELPWLNDFRQNVQDKGIFDAPDAVVSLHVTCTSPVIGHASVRNIGLSTLPAGVDVGLYVRKAGVDTQVGTGVTTHALFPGQTEDVTITANPNKSNTSDIFVAKILVDPNMPLFHECNSDNDDSDPARPICPH